MNKSSIIKELYVNIQESAAPLVAGFYLEGPTIEHKKKWNFKNDTTREIKVIKNNNLIQNYTFWYPGRYSVWVEIIGVNDIVIDKSDPKPFTVNKKTKHITSFNQWEAVIYGGDDVGFSISHDISKVPKITWEWGDEDSISKSNPHHLYADVEKPTPVVGNLSVYENNEMLESRKFAVLVIPHPINKFSGYIEISSTSLPGAKNDFHVDTEITLQAQVHGGQQPYHLVQWKYGYGLGDGGKQKDGYMIRKKKYRKSGHFHVECNIRDKVGFKLSFDKSLNII